MGLGSCESVSNIRINQTIKRVIIENINNPTWQRSLGVNNKETTIVLPIEDIWVWNPA